MLLVVFGAGASYDSVLHLPPPPPDFIKATNQQRVSRFGPHEEYRPPLANQLFEDRRLFVKSMLRFSACLPLVNLLRGEVRVEQRLARFEEEIKTFPDRQSQLTAIRYYLHEMLWTCQKYWNGQHDGITNYLTLLDAIERWRYENAEEVYYVTFNYDTMLEEAISTRWGLVLDGFSSYISQPNFRLIKLHGSIDWGIEFKMYPGNTSFSYADVIRQWPKSLDLSEHYEKVSDIPVRFNSGRLGFPAIAIPVEKKREFNCPPTHLTALADALPSVNKIITIGWRATEQHFLDMLKKRLSGLKGDVDLMTVSGTIQGARDTVNNLAIENSKGLKRVIRDGGFSGLIREIDHLYQFLRN